MPWRGRPLPLKCVFSETVERIDGNFCGKVAIPISCIYPATNPTPSRAKKKQQTNKKKKRTDQEEAPGLQGWEWKKITNKRPRGLDDLLELKTQYTRTKVLNRICYLRY